MNQFYVDTAHLNAPYKEKALEGLSGTRAYRSTADLNAQYDSLPLRGLGAGILSTGPIGSLGASTVSYPWKEYSADTLALQKATNEALKAHGYCPIGTDGKLGPGTCGAIKTMLELSGQTDQSPPSTCQSFTAPTKGPCVAGTPVPTPATPAKVTPLVKSSSFDSGTLWIVGGGAIAACAIGAAFYFTRKKGR